MEFTTVNTSGVTTALTAGSACCRKISAGTPAAGSVATGGVSALTTSGGLNHVVIFTGSDTTFYSAGADYFVYLGFGNVSGNDCVGYGIGQFSLRNRTGLYPTTQGRTLAVDANGRVDSGAINGVSTSAVTTVKAVQGLTTADTIATYTGNTPQTGDSFARIGANGASLTSLAPASTALSTATWTNARAAFLDNLNSLKVKKNTALNNFPFLMVDSTDHITPKTLLTVTVQVSLDGAAFVNATNTPATELANGVYTINLAAADLNGDTVTFKATAVGADQRTIFIATEP